jgi:hypothetical protein
VSGRRPESVWRRPVLGGTLIRASGGTALGPPVSDPTAFSASSGFRLLPRADPVLGPLLSCSVVCCTETLRECSRRRGCASSSGGLSSNSHSHGLRDLFAQAGTVTEAGVVEDQHSGLSKGFAFVFPSPLAHEFVGIDRVELDVAAVPAEAGPQPATALGGGGGDGRIRSGRRRCARRRHPSSP